MRKMIKNRNQTENMHSNDTHRNHTHIHSYKHMHTEPTWSKRKGLYQKVYYQKDLSIAIVRWGKMVLCKVTIVLSTEQLRHSENETRLHKDHPAGHSDICPELWSQKRGNFWVWGQPGLQGLSSQTRLLREILSQEGGRGVG